MNSRERVREALLCRKPDRIPKALGFFDQDLAGIAPTAPEDYFDLDIRYAEFDPLDNQDAFRDYLDTLSDWNKKPPPPDLPREVVQATTERYLEIFRRLTGTELTDYQPPRFG